MNKLNYVIAVADPNASVDDLSYSAVALGETAEVITCPKNTTFVNYIPAIIRAIQEKAPNLVITAATRNGRLLAGQLAAALKTTVLSDPVSIETDEGHIVGSRMVYGGTAYKEEKLTAAVKVACLGCGLFGERDISAIRHVEIDEFSTNVTLVEKKQKEVKQVNLGGAKRVVCAGRGIANEEVLAKLEEFAVAVDAEMGCTRPIAEENMWMPKERYIGVSGAMLKPEFYLAAGVSGQTQHMVGCNKSKVIFAICKDKNAPIFQQADYGMVGDAAVVLPELLEKMK